MTSLKEAAYELRQMAQRLEDMQANFLLPVETCSLADALNKMRLANPPGLLSIGFELNQHQGHSATVEWQCYNGKDHHKGRSLAEALAHALEEFNPPPELANVIADVQAKLEAVTVDDHPF